MNVDVLACIKICSECWVSVTRIQKFLESPELTTNRTLGTTKIVEVEDMKENQLMLSLSNVTCNWYENAVPTNTEMLDQSGVHGWEELQSNATALVGINLELRSNSLTCIIGSVGSGKVRNTIFDGNEIIFIAM